jgi:hypothetical protein
MASRAQRQAVGTHDESKAGSVSPPRNDISFPLYTEGEVWSAGTCLRLRVGLSLLGLKAAK